MKQARFGFHVASETDVSLPVPKPSRWDGFHINRDVFRMFREEQEENRKRKEEVQQVA